MQKICKQCESNFEISESDLVFYNKISPVFNGVKCTISPPSLCPFCRQQRRLLFRNERSLYQRKCDGSGKSIISIYSPDTSMRVYEQNYWWSDAWDAREYGRDFDFNKTFTENFSFLLHSAPVINLIAAQNENCDFVNLESESKNCYLNIGGHWNEECYYNTYSLSGKSNMDNYWVFKSELLYECVNCFDCYHGGYLQECRNCSDCFFSSYLRNCQNCIGCVNLRNKKYHVFNKPVSEEEYNNIVESFVSRQMISEFLEKFQSFLLMQPMNALHTLSVENSVGDYLTNSKDLYECFQCENMDSAAYCNIVGWSRNCYDMESIGKAEQCYELLASIHLYNICFSTFIFQSNDCYYCYNVYNSKNCFGCVGMNKVEYCIFNKQYAKEEYETLVLKIIEHMKMTGEWGEFFNPQLSPFAYNESVANEYFPLNSESAVTQGFHWKNKSISQNDTPVLEIADSIENVDESICKDILECKNCNRNYKIIPQEYRLYKSFRFPVPLHCPDCRHARRFALRNPRRIYNRACEKCKTDIQTSYAPERPELVYCEKCYLESIY